MNKVLVIVVAFLLIGAYIITITRGYELRESSDDRKGFLKDFSGWIVNLGRNVKDVADTAQEKEWLPKEEEYKDYSDNDTAR